MSLYYEASHILESVASGSGPLKQLVYNDKSLKSAPSAVFALVSEASKWSEVVSEVIDNSGILELERKLTPALALLLTHDLLLSKKGLSISKKHPLFDSISKHKTRLSAELTRARIRRGAQSVEILREQLAAAEAAPDSPNNAPAGSFHPRWIRINTIKTSTKSSLANTFKDHEKVPSLQALKLKGKSGIYLDDHIPDLVAVHPSIDLTKTQAYRDGHIILQDKASCFPAYLLDPQASQGSVIDGCAAPGNKTTHLAALLSAQGPPTSSYPLVTACERAKDRAQTLQAMVHRAGADAHVSVLAGQDFLAIKSTDRKWSHVTAILLDPSCSGSGIVGRDAEDDNETTTSRPIVLPTASSRAPPTSKKRKRDDVVQQPESAEDREAKNTARLRSLAAFQLRIVTHALSFPSVKRVTYSTCSEHAIENENVAVRALARVAGQGWRVLRREEQVDGMRRWGRRGDLEACREALGDDGGAAELAEACIRAKKGTEEGTMGFFVVGFVKDDETAEVVGEDEEDEWDGCSD